MTPDLNLSRRADAKNLLTCVALVAAAICVIWPIADLSFGDDTGYTHVALTLSRTGHLAYNGWESAILILHAYWGALFIKLFGFSFNWVRLSTLPYALGSVAFCYMLLRRCGLEPSSARFVTLTFGLSPLFLPVAASFMTDVPGLFFTFGSLYFYSRTADDQTIGRACFYLLLGTALGLAGGTARQVVWFVPLLGLPYMAWVRREATQFTSAALGSWMFSLAFIYLVMRWFNRQQFVVFQPSLFSELKLTAVHLTSAIGTSARIFLMLVLVCLPAVLPLSLQAVRGTWYDSWKSKLVLAVLLFALLAALWVHPTLASVPWMFSTLDWQGINGDAPLRGRPVILTAPIRAGFAVTVYLTSIFLIGALMKSGSLITDALRTFVQPRKAQFTFALMTLFSIVYLLLVVVRSSDFDVFDRYLLPVMPWFAALFLFWLKKYCPDPRALRRAMPAAWALLLIFATYAIGSTQELWSMARARASAAKGLESVGIPRTAIDAGFEYNAWTQLTLTGRMNSHWVKNPADAYRPDQSETPVVVPRYKLVYKSASDTAPSEFDSIPYFSIFPPFNKRVGIIRVSQR